MRSHLSLPASRQSDLGLPKSLYLHIRPSTQRFHLLMALAGELGCTWQDVAWEAIDEFLRKNPPKTD